MVLYSSGYVDDYSAAAGDSGRAFIQKPFHLSDFTREVRELLEEKRDDSRGHLKEEQAKA